MLIYEQFIIALLLIFTCCCRLYMCMTDALRVRELHGDWFQLLLACGIFTGVTLLVM